MKALSFLSGTTPARAGASELGLGRVILLRLDEDEGQDIVATRVGAAAGVKVPESGKKRLSACGREAVRIDLEA